MAKSYYVIFISYRFYMIFIVKAKNWVSIMFNIIRKTSANRISVSVNLPETGNVIKKEFLICPTIGK
jgi:hypothetical protein